MKQYELWDDIPNGVTVYVPEHNLLAIKLENAKLVAITEHGGRAGWMQTTGRLRGPYEDVYGKLLTLKVIEPPKPEPRQWDQLGEVPPTIRVRDKDGYKWRNKKGQWYFKGRVTCQTWVPYVSPSEHASKDYGPFTEIVK
ncbi:hypothetical protein [Mycobacteroides chelonae]|uniref:hypothetical protein n=1 Tax=Mycobacteroides chelonae TaxID=1774 RepID=UPI000994834C|nr:hypothetical protein [Mycobacteroides chelonae]